MKISEPTTTGNVVLTKRGREHVGLCPFCAEPSFTVSEGFYHCFDCGAHGDMIGFNTTPGMEFPT